MSEPAQEMWFSQTIHTHKPYWLSFNGYIYEAHFECHDILMLGKSPIKWRQHPDMTIAVDWDIKHQIKQTKPKFHDSQLDEEYIDQSFCWAL